MSDILSAKSAIHQQRYRDAYEYLLNTNLSDLSIKLQDEFWEMSTLVLRKLEDDLHYWNFYKKFFRQLPTKHKFKILKYLQSTDHYWGDSFFLKEWWESLLEVGNISEAFKVSHLYIDHLLKKKNFHKGLEFLEQMKKFYKLSVNMQVAHIRFLLLQENYKEIDKVLKTDSGELGDALFQFFYFSHNDTWKKSQYLFEVILERVYTYLEQREFPQVELRGFVNLLYEYLVFFPNESIGVLYLLKYALISKKKSYVYKVKEVVLGQDNRACTNFDYEKDILAITKALDSMQLIDTENDTIAANEFDFATDLIHGKTIRENMIKKLERDIQFLSKANKSEQVEELKAKLKMIDKDNTLFFEEKEGGTTDITVSKLEDSHITPQNYDLYPPLDRTTLVSLQSSLKNMTFAQLEASYRDYLTMLFMLEDKELLKFFIEYLQEKFSIDEKTQREIEYYKILYFRLVNDYDRAISGCDLLLAERDLEYDMEIDCLYQKAEAYFYSARWQNARACYEQVFSVDPDYRQVRYKLWMLNEK